jgi:hypothetical protein
VALFAVPLLSFHFISTNDPYTMNLRFIAADTLQKLMMLAMLTAWSHLSAKRRSARPTRPTLCVRPWSVIQEASKQTHEQSPVKTTIRRPAGRPYRPIFTRIDAVRNHIPRAPTTTHTRSPRSDEAMASSHNREDQVLIAVALLLVLSSPRAASGAPNTTPLSVRCNGAVYGAGDPFAESLAYVLADLLAATPSSRARDAYSISPYPNAFAYGHAACGGAGLTAADCATCLGSAGLSEAAERVVASARPRQRAHERGPRDHVLAWHFVEHTLSASARRPALA